MKAIIKSLFRKHNSFPDWLPKHCPKLSLFEIIEREKKHAKKIGESEQEFILYREGLN